MDILFGVLDWIQHQAWRLGIRFYWPCWLLGYAWDYRARKGCPCDPVPRRDVTFPADPAPAAPLNDWEF